MNFEKDYSITDSYLFLFYILVFYPCFLTKLDIRYGILTVNIM